MSVYVYENAAALGSTAFCQRRSAFGNVRSWVQLPDGIEPVGKKGRHREESLRRSEPAPGSGDSKIHHDDMEGLGPSRAGMVAEGRNGNFRA